jgi:uncharacterized protein YecA (UPF0149 family)
MEKPNSNNTTTTTQRRLSLPDLQKLKQEWDKREAVQATAQLSPGKLQVQKWLLWIHLSSYHGY